MSNPLIRSAQASARWSARYPGRAITAWLVLIAISIALLANVSTVTTDGPDYWQGESGRASEMTRDAGLELPSTETVLIRGGDKDELAGAAQTLDQRMSHVTGVERVSEPAWNPTATAVLVDVVLEDSETDIAPIQRVTSDVAAEFPDLEIAQAGDNSIDEAIGEVVASDLESAEVTSIPVTLILMLIAFGALIAAGIPVLLAIGSVIASIGLIAPISHFLPMEETVTSMIVLIGMAVGVDYSLFFLKREREERASGRSTIDAVEIAVATSGHSILVSGGAVIASMAGLFVVGGATFTSLAVGSILVVAIAVFGSITVLPAVLVKLGSAVDRPRIPLLWRLNQRIGRGGLSSRILAPVVRFPAVAAIISVTLLVGLAAPTLGMKINSSGLETLPKDIAEVQTYEHIAQEFPGQMLTVDVVTTGTDEDALVDGLRDLELTAVKTGHGFATMPGSLRTSDDGRTAVLSMGIDHADGSVEAGEAVEALRRTLVPQYLDDISSEFAVGGAAGENYDRVNRLADRMPLVIGFVLLLALVIMGVSFRSGIIAVLSAALNLISVGVAFGIMTLVFQHGWGSELLDFTAPGYLIEWLPLFVMVVLIGLSMDYHVFVLSRIREYVAAGLPSRLAVQRGITDTAGVVTSAAAVMVAVFSIFAVLSMMEMKMMGVGLAAAILIDATVVRLVALPAILILLGDRAWSRTIARVDRGEMVSADEPREALEPVR